MSYSINLISASVLFISFYLIFLFTGVDSSVMTILMPVMLFIYLFILFYFYLKNTLKTNILIEIGFLNLTFLLIYTLFPAIIILGGLLLQDNPLTSLLPDNFSAGMHFWRHLLLGVGFMIGFAIFRGRAGIHTYKPKNVNNEKLIIYFCFFIIFLSNFMFLIFSAPVDTYYEHYTRFDHLSSPLRALISVFVRFNWGFYSLIFLFLFLNYDKYKKIIPLLTIFLIFIDLFLSGGSRIQTLITIIGIFCLYNIFVNRISFLKIFFGSVLFVFIFTLIAIFRIPQEGLETLAGLNFAGFILNLSGELGSVYYTGFHLYEQRMLGVIPPAPWQMFFYDFWAVVPFIDITNWTPMNWYHLNYFPEALVPPMTLGPIANSAIWGGEYGLFFRGVLCGVFYAIITRFFILNKHNWIIVSMYIFCFSTTIYIMKYSIFYHMQLIIKTLIPVIFICWIISKLDFQQSIYKR